MSDTEHVMHLLRDAYARHDDAGEIAISPAKLATAVYKIIDPHKLAPLDVQMLAILELRQLARGICGRVNRDEQDHIEQQHLFTELQKRYPAHRDEDDVYVLLDNLSDDEIDLNIDRLRHEAEAKNAHADALQAYKNVRKVKTHGEETDHSVLSTEAGRPGQTLL